MTTIVDIKAAKELAEKEVRESIAKHMRILKEMGVSVSDVSLVLTEVTCYRDTKRSFAVDRVLFEVRV